LAFYANVLPLKRRLEYRGIKMARMHIESTINGEAREFLCDADQSMLDVLRDELGLTGTKEGCGTGDCGACSVLVDGRLVCSCLMLGAEAQGAEIETIEGIAENEKLHPLQTKFLENAALQCGICTPGIIVAAKALLEKDPNPDESKIRYWLAGNLCRCTGYDKIIRAVQDAAAEMSHPA
tara:strand:+ start:181 stop:720 length:540 start_codon:yes stop_codon:yes gene_type:complete